MGTYMYLGHCSNLLILVSDGESLTSGELEEFVKLATVGSALHRLSSVGEGSGSQHAREMIRSALSDNSTAMEKFHSALQDGDYDAERPKTKVLVRYYM